MLEVPHIPIRALGAFPLQDVQVHGSVEAVEIISGSIPSAHGPERWAIALRSPVEADVMIHTFDVVPSGEDAGDRSAWGGGIIQKTAWGIERALRFAGRHPGAIGAVAPPLTE